MCVQVEKLIILKTIYGLSANNNCQGLGDREKRKDVLNNLKSRQFSIYCLQDIHVTLDLESYIETQWGFKCIFIFYTGNARGVAVM